MLKYQLQIMKKMTVKQFVQEIKSPNFASEWKIKIKDRRTDRGFKEQWLTTVDNIQVTSKIDELMNYCEEENDSSYKKKYIYIYILIPFGD